MTCVADCSKSFLRFQQNIQIFFSAHTRHEKKLLSCIMWRKYATCIRWCMRFLLIDPYEKSIPHNFLCVSSQSDVYVSAVGTCSRHLKNGVNFISKRDPEFLVFHWQILSPWNCCYDDPLEIFFTSSPSRSDTLWGLDGKYFLMFTAINYFTD